MAMTELEYSAKKWIQNLLSKQGYPSYAALLDPFDFNLTKDPNVVAYIQPSKARIVVNSDLDEQQISTIVRHELLHYALTHMEREQKLRSSNPDRYKGASPDLSNIAADYEISNRGYTDKDKTHVRTLKIGDRDLRGLVTEDDHPEWVNLSYEDMFDKLIEERDEDLEKLKQAIQQWGDSGADSATQDAEQAEREANDVADKIADAYGNGSLSDAADDIADKAEKAAEAAADMKNDVDKPLDSPADKKKKEQLAKRVKQIEDALKDIKTKSKLFGEAEDAVDKEKRIKQAKDIQKYADSPLTRFKESLVGFIRKELDVGRGKTWSRFSKKYAGSGLIRPGTSRLSQNYIPLINVYFDRSGSWDADKTEEGKKAIATLNDYERQGKIKIKWYYFADEVSSEDPGGGGTYGQPILNHIEATKPDNVIIITDSDISDCRTDTIVPGGVWLLFYDGESQNLIDHLHGKKLTRIFDMNF